MKLMFFVAGLIACGMLLLSWPYVGDRFRDRAVRLKFDAAKQEAERLGAQLRGDDRFSHLKFYVWPREGVLLVFEGAVPRSNDLVELKRLVDVEKVHTPVRWKVIVSTNAPAESESIESANN
jgi:hypothetical protein